MFLRVRRRCATTLASLVLVSACNGSATGITPRPIEGLLFGQVTGTLGRPFGIGMGRNGRALALQLDQSTAGRFDLATDAVTTYAALGTNPIDVTFTRGGGRAYVTLLDGDKLFEVDMLTGATLDSARFGSRHHRILMHPSDGRFWVTSIGGMVWSVSRSAGVPLDSVSVGDHIVRGISRNPVTGDLVISYDPNRVELLDGNTLDRGVNRALGGFVQEVVHSKDGARVFVALEDANKVMVLDATTLAVQDSIVFTADPLQPFAMALSRDGNTLLVSSSQNGRLAVVNTGTLTVRRTLTPGGVPRRITFSPDGALAFVANEGGWIDVVRD